MEYLHFLYWLFGGWCCTGKTHASIWFKTFGTFCNKTSVPRSPKSMFVEDSALQMNIRDMFIPTFIGGGGRMIITWILNHACPCVHIHLDYKLIDG